MLTTAFVLSALVALGVAQDFSIPSAWRETGQNRTLAMRTTIAATGIARVASLINSSDAEYDAIGYWPTASTVLSAMANYDHFTGSTTYKTQVTDTLNKAFSLYKNYDQVAFNDDAQWWATAAYYAYRAYGDKNLLDHAVATWNHVSQFQITPAAAAAGKLSGKSFPFMSTCNGASLAGALFWRPTSDDSAVNTITTGLFMTLSAYLAEATGDAKYTTAAKAAGTWIRSYRNSAGLVLDSIDAKTCQLSDASWVFTYNTAKYIEGLTALYTVTKDNSYMSEAVNIAVAGMKNGPWQGANGVVTEGNHPDKADDSVYFKSVYVRALNELFITTTNAQLRTLIHSYLQVQYNAMLELAARGSAYSSSWAGPSQAFTAWGQAAALDNLVVAITSTT